MNKLFTLAMLLLAALQDVIAQLNIEGRVLENVTHRPLPGVTISNRDRSITTFSDANGRFFLHLKTATDSLHLSCVGYQQKSISSSSVPLIVLLTPAFTSLDEIITLGNRDAQKRTEVPAAINVISRTMINDTRATRLDMLLNKVPGVFMVDLGNEQHSMSIRQPLGYSNIFLYLEDGIPIRTVGDFNHNALIEINQASLERIEVIKGPASSLYGSEAVAGAVNFITQSPAPYLSGKIQAEAGSRGYRRTDFNISNSKKKFGFYAAGYYASQHQEKREHNDFSKVAVTLRGDYTFNAKTKLVNVADFIKYSTDQKGGLDSSHFYKKDYASFYRFTYRKVNAFRLRSTLTKAWDDNSTTSFTLFYRRSSIAQNPFYYIANVPGNATKARGQVNEDAFNSFGTVVQHTIRFPAIKAKWITGLSFDYSPATYYAKYTDIDRDSKGVYDRYTVSDSLLTSYKVDLVNSAAYTQFEINFTERLRLVAAARYDRLDYRFDNHLLPGAFSGAPDATDHFDHFTPKLGLTYHFQHNMGLYLNYSVGFAPPNITDLYTGVKVPVLKPSTYTNYEAGGWIAFANANGYAELSVYRLNGKNEIVNLRLADGTYANQNAGITRHEGIELNIKYAPVSGLMLRIGGTYANHTYVDYVKQDEVFSGNQMAQAPPYIINSEITCKPTFFKGFRVALEYQGLDSYYTDPQNTSAYSGFNILNARAGYTFKGVELWLNCINLGNQVYATTVEKSAYGTTYRPGQLRSINLGVAYSFNKK